MKSICITGATQPRLLRVSDIFQQAGMKLSNPAKRDDAIDLAHWHEQVMAMCLEEANTFQPISNPGRPWEQLASDIFIANIKSELWGWADSRSIWLLDFWLNFEPRLNFVLVCMSPQKALASAMTTEAEVFSVESVMNAWQRCHEELLRFHHRNPNRSLLVDAHEIAEHPRALIERCVALWNLPLTMPTGAASSHIDSDPLAFYLAQQLCQGYPQNTGLQNELAATIMRLGEMEKVTKTIPSEPDSALIIADYRTLRDRSAELRQVQAARDELDALKARFDDTVAGQTQHQNTLQNRIKETTQVNELLLLQLLQVQEELEATFLKNKAQSEALKAAEIRLYEAKQDNELQRSQLRKVQEDLEHANLQHQDAKRQLEATEERWQKMLQRTPDRRDDESIESLSVDVQPEAQRNDFSKPGKVVGGFPAVLRYDNLSLKREQVNPDYEHLWLRFENLAFNGKRWPEFEFRLSCAEVRPNQFGSFPKLEFPEESSQSPFEGWFIEAYDNFGAKLELRFALPDSMDLAVWQRVSENDRAFLAGLIKSLPAILVDLKSAGVQLKRPWEDWVKMVQEIQRVAALRTGVKLTVDVQPEAQRNGFSKPGKVVGGFPAVLRYDNLSLKREQVNPDYEHLWLRFENLAFNGKRWPEFEFRLSCAEVRPNQFGSFPKLEFPEESSQSPFEGWFIEAYDNFGAKLELRFALPDSMDLAVWQRVSENDRAFLAGLIKSLPAILVDLKSAGVQLKRPWEDWVKMVQEIQRVAALRTAPPSSPAPAAQVHTVSVSATGKA